VDAILDSGVRRTVFVDRGNGVFEPREVETGWRMGDRVEIVRGLEPGERIVTSGNFLIDWESRLEMAAAGMQGTLSKDPVCGVDVSMKKAARAGSRSTTKGRRIISTRFNASNSSKKIRNAMRENDRVKGACLKVPLRGGSSNPKKGV
jgi:hypothetical protein